MKFQNQKLSLRSSTKRATPSDWTRVNALKTTFRCKRSENLTSINKSQLNHSYGDQLMRRKIKMLSEEFIMLSNFTPNT